MIGLLLLAAECFAIAAAVLAYPIHYSRRITRRRADSYPGKD